MKTKELETDRKGKGAVITINRKATAKQMTAKSSRKEWKAISFPFTNVKKVTFHEPNSLQLVLKERVFDHDNLTITFEGTGGGVGGSGR